MKAVVLYHPNSEHARLVEEYARDYERSKGKSLTLVSLETTAGADLAKLYDIVQYPAIVVTTEDNLLVKYWDGIPLPLMDEVDSYSVG